jgi:transcriptional regulator with XRE-family HTH domain
MLTSAFSPHRLVQARLKAGMTQSDLAFKVRDLSGSRFKVTQAQVSKWEAGRSTPQADVIPVIAEATGKSIEYFYASGADDDEEEAALLGTPHDLANALQAVIERAVREQHEKTRDAA